MTDNKPTSRANPVRSGLSFGCLGPGLIKTEMNGAGIRYGRALVGVFEAEEVPRVAGEYAYMPMRNLPHLKLSKAASAGEGPLCNSGNKSCSVTFRVVAIPRPHVMTIDEVVVADQIVPTAD